MNGTENSGHYRNAFQKHEERKKKLKQLTQKVQYEALLGLASALGITPEDLLRILAGVQGIDPISGRRIDYLWAIEFGRVRVEVPKPFLEPIKCTAFSSLSGLEHGKTLYMAVNHRDILPYFVEYGMYDHAMDAIRAWLDDWVTAFFRRKDKAMGLVGVPAISMSTHYGPECPEARRYEFELIDNFTEELRYGLAYATGKIIWSQGNLPLEDIAAVLKGVGVWE